MNHPLDHKRSRRTRLLPIEGTENGHYSIGRDKLSIRAREKAALNSGKCCSIKNPAESVGPVEAAQSKLRRFTGNRSQRQRRAAARRQMETKQQIVLYRSLSSRQRPPEV